MMGAKRYIAYMKDGASGRVWRCKSFRSACAKAKAVSLQDEAELATANEYARAGTDFFFESTGRKAKYIRGEKVTQTQPKEPA